MKPVEITLCQDDLRLIGLWAADCAERALPLFVGKVPSDPRPQSAIEGIRVFGRGGKRTVELRSHALAALAAAREVGDGAATAAARAAGFAAAIAYTKALANPHHAKHALGPAVYAAQAHELATGNDPGVGDKEIRWAINHATPTVRKIISRWPARVLGRTHLSALYFQLDSGLRN